MDREDFLLSLKSLLRLIEPGCAGLKATNLDVGKQYLVRLAGLANRIASALDMMMWAPPDLRLEVSLIAGGLDELVVACEPERCDVGDVEEIKASLVKISERVRRAHDFIGAGCEPAVPPAASRTGGRR